ncbi:hypothetical protein RvY_04053 [Ramazzottius varieornatus]|uniref:Sulfatase N-terminal domain-containing protein n=1 Tax=Ramazzottius varieornatus TaxID=947166 RepID=A0A1D1V0B0_RAMVA|nr:hypothetical protein RvY_04053 [Ramazzottius varieornatus]
MCAMRKSLLLRFVFLLLVTVLFGTNASWFGKGSNSVDNHEGQGNPDQSVLDIGELIKDHQKVVSDEVKKRPNIVLFLADDLGHTDVGYSEGNIQTPTPNIDKFAWDGLILNRHYTHSVCTPSRAILLTSKYSFHTGMQTHPIGQGQPWGLNLKHKLMPTYFKQLGYKSYHLGKWHLGEFKRDYYPNNRGFDYSYGVTGGAANWFNYTEGWVAPPLSGRTLRENGKMVHANITNNVYLPDLLTAKAEQVIRLHAHSETPFLLYFCTPVPHTAFEDFLDIQQSTPQYQLRKVVYEFSYLYPNRKRQLAAIQAMDESFKRIIDALDVTGKLGNTIIVFISDNGAPMKENSFFIHGVNFGSNWPLRQGKGTLFEGGVRTVSFIWSPLLERRGTSTDHIFHASDWLPTLYEAVGGDLGDLKGDDHDGVSHWKTFNDPASRDGPRQELVLNIDAITNSYSMIKQAPNGNLYKLIGGNVFGNLFTGWNRVEGTNETDDSWKNWSPASVDCRYPEGMEVSKCEPWLHDCLFDVTEDPCEQRNVAYDFPDVLRSMQERLKHYNATAVPSATLPFDPNSDPAKWGGWWVPWKDEEPMDIQPLNYSALLPSWSI